MASAIDELARKLYVDLPICGKVPNPFHPYGVRGVGETPIVAPLAALSNAVRDQLGFRIDDLPLSPPRVLEAIDEQRGATDPSELSHATSRGNQQPRATFGRGILTGLLLAVVVVLSGTTLPAASATDEDCPPGAECVRVVGQRITCEDGWICSDGAPPNLALNCWRDITPIRDARVSGAFWEPRDGRPHKGTDLAVPNGTPVHALKDGQVRSARGDLPRGDSSTSMGNYVIIDYDDGTVGRYFHLLSVFVEGGWSVAAGDKIAESNQTGRTDGVHLHYDFAYRDDDGEHYGDVALEHPDC